MDVGLRDLSERSLSKLGVFRDVLMDQAILSKQCGFVVSGGVRER
jgi:hypothetical protein